MNVTRDLQADHYLVTHTVGPQSTGVRLDAFLKSRYRRRSRERLQQAIRSGVVTVIRGGGAHLTIGKLKPSTQLLGQDEVRVLTARRPEPPVDFGYRILHEDEHLLVVDKPPNLPVHPAGAYFFNTLIVHMKTQGFTAPLAADREYFLVHRIDKETSGVLVMAKTSEVCAGITEQFRSRTTEKRYLAVVHGETAETFEVALALMRDPKSAIRVKMTTVADDAPGALAALTRFRTLSTVTRGGLRYSLVECFPKTGRQHQIRAHLASKGHPIVGDKLYSLAEEDALRFYEATRITRSARKSDTEGMRAVRHVPAELEAKLLLPRQALHAAGIAFRHPLSGERLEFRAELPADLLSFLSNARPSRAESARAPEATIP